VSDWEPIKVRPGIACRLRLTKAIKKLEQSEAYRKPLQSPSCVPDDPEGLVSRVFNFAGKGRNVNITVTVHAKVMVGLLRAIRARRSIQVTQSSTSKYSGSYRTYAQQKLLYDEYKAGQGHKAAHPCSGYHRQGRAVDLYLVSWPERQAMLNVRVDGLKFYDGLSFGDPPHFTLGAKG
jgi:hypothetical protein